jgi:hypothetical protein
MCATHKLFPTDMDPCDDKETQDMIKKYKVAPCPKRYPHDWSSCTYYHPREKARRRDPRKHQYTGIACPSMRQARGAAVAPACSGAFAEERLQPPVAQALPRWEASLTPPPASCPPRSSGAASWATAAPSATTCSSSGCTPAGAPHLRGLAACLRRGRGRRDSLPAGVFTRHSLTNPAGSAPSCATTAATASASSASSPTGKPSLAGRPAAGGFRPPIGHVPPCTSL